MNRRHFLGLAALAGGGVSAMQLKNFFDQAKDGASTSRMPSIFIGHGNPINAILDNNFTQQLHQLGQRIERPKAVLVVSAHWLTQRGSFVSVNPKPETIHDFGGFPDELFAVQYPAPGAPEQAKQVVANVKSIQIHEHHDMGLDHGAWSILKHIYPNAEVPVFQLSIDWDLGPAQHYALAQELQGLRDKGILILGSGNVVHNLGRVNWQEGGNARPYDWAQEFDAFVERSVASRDDQALIEFQKLGTVASMAHPTYDHYLPLLYTMGASAKSDQLNEIYSSIDMGSVSMRSFLLS